MCDDGVLAKGTLQWLSPEPRKLVWSSMRFKSSYHWYHDVSAGSVLVWVFYDLYIWATYALYTHGQYCWLLIKVDSKKVPPLPPCTCWLSRLICPNHSTRQYWRSWRLNGFLSGVHGGYYLSGFHHHVPLYSVFFLAF